MSEKLESDQETSDTMFDPPGTEEFLKHTAAKNHSRKHLNTSDHEKIYDRANEQPDNQGGLVTIEALISTEAPEVGINDPEGPPEASLKLMQFPISRLKSIIKLVPSVGLVNSEATVAIGKATELFLRELVTEAHQMTLESGKKTLSAAHIEGVIQTLPQFEFLDGMLI